MTEREQSFGKAAIKPRGNIDHLEDGTYYLTKIDKNYIRYYALKDTSVQSASQDLEGTRSPTLPRNSQVAQRLD